MGIGLAGNRMCGGMKKTKALILMAALLAMAGCATVEGLGRDISGGAQRVGSWLG